MIKFRIEGQEYNIPDYLTIGDYVKIYKVKDLFTEDYFAAKLLNIVSDAPLQLLLDSEYNEIEYLAYHVLSKMSNPDKTFHDRFELDGVHYGFFPNWKDLTFAEFVDMDTISSKPAEELLDMLHVLAAVMYRPIVEQTSEHDFKIEEYNLESLKKRADLFKQKLDIKYIIGAQFFFIKFAKRYLDYSQQYSMPTLSIWKQMKWIWHMWRMIYKIRSRKPTDGSSWSTELRKMILLSTNTSSRKTS
jgi:hypothetical protein